MRLTPALIASDIDGTLDGADHKLSARTVEVLSQLGAYGVEFVIVTGRSERSALGTARSLGLTAPVICCNGALVTDPVSGQRLQVNSMSVADAQRAVNIARGCGADPLVWTADAWYAERDSAASRLLTLLLDEGPISRPLDEVIAAEPVVKIMVGGDPALLDAEADTISTALPGMERSMHEYFEAAPAGASKQEAMAFVLHLLGVSPADAWGFGDGGNDIGWLSGLGRKIAPANARPAVLALADEVIGLHSDDAVAEYVNRTILQGRCSAAALAPDGVLHD
jgi:Cof subfamily protein (haloacid dehalogenase superfamily)